MTVRRLRTPGALRPRRHPLARHRVARHRVAWHLVAVALVVTGLLSVLATPAVAPTASAAPAGVGSSALPRQATTPTASAPLTLIQQDPWIGPRGELRIVVETVTDVESTLEVRVFGAVDDPDLVRQPEEVPTTRQVRQLEPIAVAAGRQRLTVRLAVVPEADGTFGDPLVLDPGVYPVTLTLTRPDRSVRARLTTHLVRLPETATPRPLALVVPIHADPDRTSDGRTLVDATVRTALDRRLDLLAAHPSVPVTLQVTPETVNALASDRTGAGTATLDRISSLVSDGSEVVASPFVRLDADSWFRPEGIGLLGSELDLGRATLDAAGLGTVGDTAAIGDRLDDDLIRWLAGRGLRRLVVPAEAVAGATWPAAPARAGDPALTIVPMTSIGRQPGDDAVLAAYRSLAAATLGVIDGSLAAGQGWALGLPADTADDSSFLRTILDALDRSGPFLAATVSRFELPSASDGADASTSVRWVPMTPEDLGDLPATLNRSATRLASVGTMVGEQPLLVRARGLIYVAASRDLDDAQRRMLVDGLDSVVPLLLGAVTLPRDDGIVVTSHRATLPIVIRYDGPTPIQIAVAIRSSELEIEGENPRLIELVPGANDLEVPIRSRRSGEFELEIVAMAPDGVVVLQTARLTVQSRAISGVGLLLSIGALAYLVVWWFRNHRRRRGLAQVPATPDEAAPPDPETGAPPPTPVSPTLAGATAADPPRRASDRPVP